MLGINVAFIAAILVYELVVGLLLSSPPAETLLFYLLLAFPIVARYGANDVVSAEMSRSRPLKVRGATVEFPCLRFGLALKTVHLPLDAVGAFAISPPVSRLRGSTARLYLLLKDGRVLIRYYLVSHAERYVLVETETRLRALGLDLWGGSLQRSMPAGWFRIVGFSSRIIIVVSFVPMGLALVALGASAFAGPSSLVPLMLTLAVELALFPGLYVYQHVRAARHLIL
jgi:hypothetical protein